MPMSQTLSFDGHGPRLSQGIGHLNLDAADGGRAAGRSPGQQTIVRGTEVNAVVDRHSSRLAARQGPMAAPIGRRHTHRSRQQFAYIAQRSVYRPAVAGALLVLYVRRRRKRAGR